MNTPPTPDLESLRKAVQEFQPVPHRVPFTNLKLVHDSIVKLRARTVSYAAIAELLQQHGVKTSRARVAEYGRIVLDSGKSRKRRKRSKTTLAASSPPPAPSVPTVAAKSAPTMLPATTITGDVTLPPQENSAFASCGPRIAKVAMMSPQEAAEFEASLKPGNATQP